MIGQIRLFYQLLGNTLLAHTTNNFVWFALTFWAIVETRSVLVASFIAGIFAVTNMIGALYFGHFVDHHHKRTAMLLSSVISLGAFAGGGVLYFLTPSGSFSDASSVYLWVLTIILMIGTVAGNLRTIALSTTVTLLFTEGHDRANGLVGTMQGVSFALTSILSGLVIGFLGMGSALVIAIIATTLCLFHLLTITWQEAAPIAESDTSHPDLRATIGVILAIPGLMALVFFNTFNNFLGGVFMALMDAYGLALVSVETWGALWGTMSVAMIMSGILVTRYGTGKNPLRAIMLVNLISWTTCIIFPLQPSIILLALGMFTWMFFFPIAEAAEQTVIQTIVPQEQQGRVFGFAQSVESAASPVTAFLIGPLAQFFFIPLMTTGAGSTIIGDWFGTGPDRGIALVFICAGIIGLAVTIIACYSRAYHALSKHITSA